MATPHQQWAISKSKMLLEHDLLNEKIKVNTPAEKVRKMHEEHEAWPVKFWTVKFKTLRKKLVGGAKQWDKSKSKQLIQEGILNLSIPPGMSAEEVQRMDKAHQKWPTVMLEERLNAVRNQIKRDQLRAKEDAIRYKSDLQFVKALRKANDEKLPWHLSPAASQLKADMKAGKHELMKPEQLYRSNPVYYENFPLVVFRKHIYQIKDSEQKRAYRFEKKKSKSKYPHLLELHERNKNSK